ncbi:MAG: PaaI family thioesterase [Pseudomonadota bacterium]
MTLDEIKRFLLGEFPQVFQTQALAVEHAKDGHARLRLTPDAAHLRPGDVVSGPTLMMLADAGAYAALLSLGEGAKMAVTTNLNISFLRAAAPGAQIVQTADVIKQGRRLSVIVAEAQGPDGTVLAHTTMTYAMPTAG